MAMKRKFDLDHDDTVEHVMKHARKVPFPLMEVDTDVAMSDGSVSDFEVSPFASLPQYHSRISSNASSSSNLVDSANDPTTYPVFNLYPLEEGFIRVDTSGGSPKEMGLLQPKDRALMHHGHGCKQIPKLRVACSPGLNGQRTMWAHCEECGAIEMVETN